MKSLDIVFLSRFSGGLLARVRGKYAFGGTE